MAPQLVTVSRQLTKTDRIIRRRLMKQMVERRRRERIDLCLENIKALVLTNLNQKPADYKKMEKADILDMTVHYLANLVKSRSPHDDVSKQWESCCMSTLSEQQCLEQSEQQCLEQTVSSSTLSEQQCIEQTVSSSTLSEQQCLEQTVSTSYVGGFQKCLNETHHFLNRNSTSVELKTRLVSHLESSLKSNSTTDLFSAHLKPSVTDTDQGTRDTNVQTNVRMCKRSPKMTASSSKSASERESRVSPFHSGDFWRPW